jgi:hypothetical protein
VSAGIGDAASGWVRMLPHPSNGVSTMSDLDKLKKENKQLKALLKKAVRLLNNYKEVLKKQQEITTAKNEKKKKKKSKK